MQPNDDSASVEIMQPLDIGDSVLVELARSSEIDAPLVSCAADATVAVTCTAVADVHSSPPQPKSCSQVCHIVTGEKRPRSKLFIRTDSGALGRADDDEIKSMPASQVTAVELPCTIPLYMLTSPELFPMGNDFSDDE